MNSVDMSPEGRARRAAKRRAEQPAFPTASADTYRGMTKREYIATEIMATLAPESAKIPPSFQAVFATLKPDDKIRWLQERQKHAASAACELADALLIELAERGEREDQPS